MRSVLLILWVAIRRIQIKYIYMVLYEKGEILHLFTSSEVPSVQIALSIWQTKVNQSCTGAMISFKQSYCNTIDYIFRVQFQRADMPTFRITEIIFLEKKIPVKWGEKILIRPTLTCLCVSK